MSVTLRMMTKPDLDAVVRLEHALFGEEAWTRQMLSSELDQQPASRYYLVAEDAGQIVGYAGLLGAGWQADVLTLAVATSHWGHGIGSSLLSELLAEAARRGCTEVFLEVRTDNTRAQRLYRRFDFTEVGIRHRYYQPSGADALVMRRQLTGQRAGAGDDCAGDDCAGDDCAGDDCAGDGSASDGSTGDESEAGASAAEEVT